MDRVEFTAKIVMLLFQMIKEGESPIIDYVKRSAEEQKRLFDAGLSKCDGIEILSMHQTGRAVDIYFVDNGKLIEPLQGFDYWHTEWEKMGGEPEIEWDKGHFEGR